MYIYRAKETPRRNGQIRVPGRTNRQTREIAAGLRVHGGYIISVCTCVFECPVYGYERVRARMHVLRVQRVARHI